MASKFFSKFGKASTTSDDNVTTLANSTTDTTKDTKKRRSASREPSSKSTKSRKSSDDTTSTHRSAFGIPTLARNSSSRNRALSNPPVNHSRTSSAGNSTTSFHRKADSTSASPPVPGVGEGLKVGQKGGGVRRNSIISVVFGGGKNKDNNSSIVPQPPTGPTPSTGHGDTSALGLEHDDDGSPGIPTIITVGPSLSRESLDSTSSTQLGVTVIPPSPLVYSGSLPSTHSRSVEDLPTTTEVDTPSNHNPEHKAAGQEPGAQAQPQEVTTPTTATSTSTTASVLVSIFGRRPRTSSISSAISGIIGVGGGTTAKDKPSDIDVGSTEQRASSDNDPKTPTTAATIKANYFESQKEDPPPLPTTNRSQTDGNMAPNRSNTAMPAQEVQRKTSARSMTNIPPPISVPDYNVVSSSKSAGHARAVTSPEGTSYEHDGAVTMTPIVESPTAFKQDFPVAPSSSTSSANRRDGSGGFGALLTPKKGGDDDTASIISISSKSPGKDKDGEKKRLFKRSTTRKPTGLASAIAATGMAMANPSISVVHAAQMSAAAAQNTKADSAGVSSKGHPPGTMPYISKSPTSSGGLQGPQRSATTLGSPRSKGRKASGGSTGRSPTGSSYNINSASSRKHSRRPSVSAHSDGGNSWTGGLSVNGGGSEYYSGNESEGARSRVSQRRGTGGNSGNESDTEDEDSDSGDDSSSDDLLDGLDLEDEDIPVTGFAVASNKRNADFHELFPSVPEGDYLIEDYGCALQREILIQGRLYISENHICFHANIFGWITDLAIPTDEITTLEKKMTAFVIPNAIQITTRQARYTFASFLSRDTTYDVIYNIWRLARPDDVRSVGRSSMEGAGNTSTSLVGGAGPGAKANGAEAGAGGGAAIAKKVARKATQCTCGREGRHYTETAMEATFPGSPEMIHNLMFASGFIKEFLSVNQKLTDIQTTDWMPVTDGSSLLKRNMSYIKPLNAPMGPKQTKCEIQDEMDYLNFDQHISTVSTTRTPDVPSGGVFMVKTRTCIMWAGPVSSKVLVTTQVEWTGRSFIKGIIERSAIDGQKVYHGDLEKAMRAYIQEHHGEFVPEGADVAEIIEEEAAEAAAAEGEGLKSEDGPGGERSVSQEQREKQREKERNQRAWQWAWDTFEDAFDVAKRSSKTALDLVVDAWDQSSSTTILYFVIVILVLSNLYTLVRMGKKEEVGRRKEMMKAEERERWVQSVVMTLWEELATGKKEAKDLRDRFVDGPPSLESIAAAVGSNPSAGMAVHPPLSLPTSPEGGTSASKLPPGMESSIPTGSTPPKPASWREEVAHLSETLAMVEERIASIKQSLASFEKLDSLD